jgi:DNA polymerase V
MYSAKVSAGFPSPAEDYVEGKIDLNKELVPKPSDTFFVRVTGNSMINAGIRENDVLIVDRSCEPRHNKIVIAVVDGELTVKRLLKRNNKVILAPENEQYPALEITSEDLSIWGVVTYIIHKA